MHELREKRIKQAVYELLEDEISRANNETVEQYKQRLLDLTEELWEITVQ